MAKALSSQQLDNMTLTQLTPQLYLRKWLVATTAFYYSSWTSTQ